jgi:hypothetical protein
MRMQTYLRVVSDETTICSLQREANIPGSTVKQPKSSTGGIGEERWWSWQTAIVDLDLNDEDRGVKNLLIQCRPLLLGIKKYQGPATEVILEVVTHYRQKEGSPGLYLSAESISLLSEVGGSLDHDAVLEVS